MQPAKRRSSSPGQKLGMLLGGNVRDRFLVESVPGSQLQLGGLKEGRSYVGEGRTSSLAKGGQEKRQSRRILSKW